MFQSMRHVHTTQYAHTHNTTRFIHAILILSNSVVFENEKYEIWHLQGVGSQTGDFCNVLENNITPLISNKYQYNRVLKWIKDCRVLIVSDLGYNQYHLRGPQYNLP